MKNLTIIFYLFAICSVRAQKQNEFNEPNNIVIEGKVTDPMFNSVPDTNITVMLWVTSFPSKINIAPTEYYSVITKPNKPFKLSFIAPAKRFYIHIGFVPNSFQMWSSSDNMYVMDKDDQITCKLSCANFEFSGKGSDKFNCQSDIYHYRYLATAEDIQFRKNRQFNELFDYRGTKKDSLLKLKLETIEKYARSIGKETTELMIANSYGQLYYSDLKGERGSYNDFERVKALTNSSEYKINLNKLNDISPNVLVSSPIFSDFLFEKEVVRSMFWAFKDGKVDLSYDRMRFQFNSILEDYSGPMREKLLTLFFLNYNKNKKSIPPSYFKEAIAQIHNPDYQEILHNIQKTNSKDTPFFPFEIEDNNGKTLKLVDFRNKVVIMDFWFTGCINCIKLKKHLVPLVDTFKDNPNVKFVSINIDKSKESWLESIKTNNYTDSNSINLYAGGGQLADRNSRHPLINAYNITSFPTLFILNNGKLYEPTPPRGNIVQMINIVNKALEDRQP
ncbi:TlpA family protein disulfide reductase [Pedobacter sp. MC2016-14]|uniref:TlpA family protein disulfide reductase n=1 Tax=Pedobacter sp. MC2016-14 TaxID=2897327 RepID=UPI001E5F1F7B|nr:TlpA disulfide reductase family protein [Pedobacter sp. MC2016-14]MCD0489694.1 TlpA family protein disulfide reductase [Pedobacter sp. MC2016-14]